MELRQLRYFVETARLNHFTKAAEVLHVAQPALSRQINKLEEELDIVLFDRKNRTITLTKDGLAFLEKAKVILEKVEEAKTEVEERKGLEKGSITIGLPSTTGSYYFPKIISQFKKAYPNIQIFLVEKGTIKIQELIERGEIDLGVVVSPVTSEKIKSIPLISQEIFICLSPQHALAKQRSVSFEDLRNNSFILFKDGYFYRKFIMQECNKAGFDPRIMLETNQIEMIKSLISLDLGISLFIKMVVENDPRIVAVPLDPPMILHLSIAWNKEKYLTQAASAFLDFIKRFHNM